MQDGKGNPITHSVPRSHSRALSANHLEKYQVSASFGISQPSVAHAPESSHHISDSKRTRAKMK